MNVYFDGSHFSQLPDGTKLKGKQLVASYGIVIDDGDKQLELMGAVKGMQINGLHEALAFGEAVLWLDSHQVKAETVSFIGDDQTVIYGALSFNAGWASTGHWDCLLDSFKRLVTLGHLPTDILEKTMPYVNGSRFHKVKSHRRCVNNNRCDYLAKTAGRRLLQIKHKFVDFEHWLALGFIQWSHAENTNVTWHPPTFAAAQ